MRTSSRNSTLSPCPRHPARGHSPVPCPLGKCLVNRSSHVRPTPCKGYAVLPCRSLVRGQLPLPLGARTKLGVPLCTTWVNQTFVRPTGAQVPRTVFPMRKLGGTNFWVRGAWCLVPVVRGALSWCLAVLVPRVTGVCLLFGEPNILGVLSLQDAGCPVVRCRVSIVVVGMDSGWDSRYGTAGHP